LVESQYASWGGSKYITSEGNLVREKNYYYLVISDNTLKTKHLTTLLDDKFKFSMSQ